MIVLYHSFVQQVQAFLRASVSKIPKSRQLLCESGRYTFLSESAPGRSPEDSNSFLWNAASHEFYSISKIDVSVFCGVRFSLVCRLSRSLTLFFAILVSTVFFVLCPMSQCSIIERCFHITFRWFFSLDLLHSILFFLFCFLLVSGRCTIF